MSKSYDELAVKLVEAWLNHNSEVFNEIGRTSTKGQHVSVKEVAQAYLDFSHVILNSGLPENLQDSTDESD